MKTALRLAALLTAALSTAGWAADHPVQGDFLKLKDSTNAKQKRVIFRAVRDAAIDPAAAPDPRSTGATFEVVGAGAADGASGAIALDPSLWTGLGKPAGSKGYRYLDRTVAFGIRKVVFKPGNKGGKLIVVGKDANWPYSVNQPQQGPIAVRFDIGGEVYCARFEAASFVKNDNGILRARNAAAPADCSLPICGNGVTEPPETCDDGNTASGDGCSDVCQVEIPVVCGNGVAQGTEECDDGNLADGDGCSATCQLENTSAVCAGVASVSGTSLATVPVASGLQSPVYIGAPRLDPNRVFVVEQPGRIRVVNNGTLLATPFLDIHSKVTYGGERGLLSVAFHPDYESNGRFFVDYTNLSGNTVIARYDVSADPNVADDTSEKILLTITQDFANHNGGLVLFGPDGYLYVGMGDGGSGGDPNERAQDDTSLLGKLLRIDVDVDTPPYYTVPPTNPGYDSGNPTDPLGLIWAKGLRNPWRYSFDRANGDLYIGDVGQDTWEEVDYTPAGTPGGLNYGWDVFEGNACYDPAPHFPSCSAAQAQMTFPIYTYNHSFHSSCSITGGAVYRGCAMPDLRGSYFLADYCGAWIHSFEVVAGAPQNEQDRTAELDPPGAASINSITSFGEDARGELYIADQGGEIYRIVPGP